MLGPRLRELRLERKFKQNYVAHVCGFSESYLSQVELGTRGIRDACLSKIADCYKLGEEDRTELLELARQFHITCLPALCDKNRREAIVRYFRLLNRDNRIEVLKYLNDIVDEIPRKKEAYTRQYVHPRDIFLRCNVHGDLNTLSQVYRAGLSREKHQRWGCRLCREGKSRRQK